MTPDHVRESFCQLGPLAGAAEDFPEIVAAEVSPPPRAMTRIDRDQYSRQLKELEKYFGASFSNAATVQRS